MALGEGHSTNTALPSQGPKNLFSRIWHFTAAFMYFILTIVTLVSVLVFALFNKSFRFFGDSDGVANKRCLLFADLHEVHPSQYTVLSHGGTLGASCAFSTWAGAAVCIAVALLCVYSVVKALIGVKA